MPDVLPSKTKSRDTGPCRKLHYYATSGDPKQGPNMVLISGTAYSFSYKRPQNWCQILTPVLGPQKLSKNGASTTFFCSETRSSDLQSPAAPDASRTAKQCCPPHTSSTTCGRQCALSKSMVLCTSAVTLCDKVLPLSRYTWSSSQENVYLTEYHINRSQTEGTRVQPVFED
jgi:hypothetical protein